MKSSSSKPLSAIDSKKNVKEFMSVKFGSVTVSVSVPTAVEARSRVMESRHVMQRLKEVVSKPGVKVAMKKTTPIYTVDSANPDLVVKKVGNKKVRGQFKNGKFIAVAA